MIKSMIYQFIRGLDYIHNVRGIIHSDVKGENMLVDPKTGVLKICDFGSGK